jgi:FkbM family methyltransferase
MNNILVEKIKKIRKEKKQLNFLQIGAYDGQSLDDIANKILNENDKGIFIEPNPYVIEQLRQNKKNYINSEILPFAIIPDNNFYHKHFHVHKNGGGSTFIKGLLNDEILESGDYEIIDIKTITVEDLFKKYINFNVDIVFTDCEGYDFDINKNILNFCKPKILHMEAWNIDNSSINNNTKQQKITTRTEMFEFLHINGYETIFESYGENLICYLK